MAAEGAAASQDQLQGYMALMGFNFVLLTSFSPVLMQQWNSVMGTMPRPGGDGSSGGDSGSYGDVGDDSTSDDWIGSFGDSDFSSGFEGAYESGSSGGDWGGGSDSGGGDSDGVDGGGDGGGGD